MKRLSLLAIGLLLMLTACAPSLEDKGDKYTEQAKKATNVGTKFKYQKAAFTMYKKAVAKEGDKLSQSLRSKYVGALTTRMRNVGGEHEEGFEATEVVELRKEAQKYVTMGPVDAPFADDYAKYLVDYAKFLKDEKKLVTKCFLVLSQAEAVAADKSVAQAKMTEVKGEFIKAKMAEALSAYETGKKDEDTDEILKADYFAREVIIQDSTNADAKALLGKTTKALIGSYTAYEQVFTDPAEEGLDTTIYKKISNQRVYMGFSKFEKKRTTLTLEGTIFNSAYNAVRLRKDQFTLYLADGKTLKPSSANFSKKMLDTERDAEMDLKFTKVTAAPKMIKFSSVDGDITSEKLLMY